MTFDDCIKKGLIRKSENTKEKIEQSLVLGDKFLKAAEKNLKMEEYEVSEIISYNALFHYARALLFQKEYNERSHACLFLALKELYPDQKELFDRADKIRVERHNLQYSGLVTDLESVEYALEFVKEFRDKARKLLKR
jgi:uncharacterized protein (UPF0332 family)